MTLREYGRRASAPLSADCREAKERLAAEHGERRAARTDTASQLAARRRFESNGLSFDAIAGLREGRWMSNGPSNGRRSARARSTGRAVGTLVVHALARQRNEVFPRDAADWRRVWAEAGVACNDLSCDVLVLNLPGFVREPLRLTLRQVMTWQPPALARSSAFACENPAVVAAAVDRLGDATPATAALIVLLRLSEYGQTIRYHGDFDWRGLVIARVVARKLPTATPWRYGSADYEQAIAAGLGTVELAGVTTTSPWDEGLVSAMESAGLAIDEEQVLSELLDDLDCSIRPCQGALRSRTPRLLGALPYRRRRTW